MEKKRLSCGGSNRYKSETGFAAVEQQNNNAIPEGNLNSEL